jgi:hypothetical protein
MDPATFTMAQSLAWVAYTIAISPVAAPESSKVRFTSRTIPRVPFTRSRPAGFGFNVQHPDGATFEYKQIKPPSRMLKLRHRVGKSRLVVLGLAPIAEAIKYVVQKPYTNLKLKRIPRVRQRISRLVELGKLPIGTVAVWFQYRFPRLVQNYSILRRKTVRFVAFRTSPRRGGEAAPALGFRPHAEMLGRAAKLSPGRVTQLVRLGLAPIGEFIETFLQKRFPALAVRFAQARRRRGVQLRLGARLRGGLAAPALGERPHSETLSRATLVYWAIAARTSSLSRLGAAPIGETITVGPPSAWNYFFAVVLARRRETNVHFAV